MAYETAHPETARGGAGPATAWLKTHRPDYRSIVHAVFNDLLAQTRALLKTRAPLWEAARQ